MDAEYHLGQTLPPKATPLVRVYDEELVQEIKGIPNRLAFKIGEVADMLQVKSHVLRYWESEFSALKPRKASNNQRMYSRKDVEIAFVIRKLLHRDRFSIEGARKALTEYQSSTRNSFKDESPVEDLQMTIRQAESIMESIQALRQALK